MNSCHDINKTIYRRRFEEDVQFRIEMYNVLCKHFFQKYIPHDATILEIGAGYCEFINAIQAKRKIAIDVNPDTRTYADDSVEVIITQSTQLDFIGSESVDRVFVNNFFEHITKPDIVKTLEELHRILKMGGEILVLQPNIRYCTSDYWMFFDHITPLDDRSMTEALEIAGFSVVECIPRFLPYSTKSRLPKSLIGLKFYLSAPVLWKLIGKQAFIRAEKQDF